MGTTATGEQTQLMQHPFLRGVLSQTINELRMMKLSLPGLV
jgi:hypothetical protein